MKRSNTTQIHKRTRTKSTKFLKMKLNILAAGVHYSASIEKII